MARCHVCRDKEAELLTWWEKTRYWLFVKINSSLFTQDFEDLKSEKYTKGFGDGFIDGTDKEKTSHARMRELYAPTEPIVGIEDRVELRLIELLSPIDPRKVITFDDKSKQIFIGGVAAEPAQLKNLKSEADALVEFGLFDLLYHTPKALAEKALFKEGDSLTQLQKGRTMLYTLDTQKKIVDTLRSVR